jgi:lipopolysaccharide/colanic/teichoic acid biosynthesis glycosyltransferase
MNIFKLKMTYRVYIKRLFDFSFALVLLIITMPITVPIFILLAIQNNGDIFFKQSRPGYKENVFKIFKFKTMTDEKDSNGNLLPDAKRLTKLGKFVRSTSIDELPQLINVIRGDMSFIGPRPLLLSYLKLYNKEQKKRHNVKPGITGWAQVNGRNQLDWKDRFKLDVWYIENQSFLLDVKIFFLTIVKIIKREGINNATATTMKPFKGN